eukprot:NODE_61_length_2296_cov_227.544400.p1 GENE.NODE_61_length_2296_cov_227.544400~~NODE_61_length_2296_cov_227.544400.p1  ORF type:complete len:703 (-),score=331.39 NODE_61_length_2296_cov_227.544400:85-2193(-)
MGFAPNCLIILALAPATSLATEQREATSAGANPIRRVVSMLERMQEKVTEEGEQEAELHEKFLCWCKNSADELHASISAADAKGPQMGSRLGDAESEGAKLTAEVEQHRADRDAAKTTMAEATALREKDAAAFAAAKAELNTNIDTVTKAIAAIAKGSGSFVQTDAAQALRKFVTVREMADNDRQDVLAFLSGSQTAGYAPESGEVSGILKQLSDDMKGELAAATEKEEAAIKTYGELMAAQKKEVAALTASIEDKLERAGKLGVQAVTVKAEMANTRDSHEEEEKFLANVEQSCAQRQAEWQQRKQIRAEELHAIAETIKVLNDDEALELFKKTLPSPDVSFLQVTSKTAALKAQALRVIQALPRHDQRGARPELDFIAVALQGKKVSFDKVIGMIDAMAATLKQEQADDDQKKEYCNAKFAEKADQQKAQESKIGSLDTAIAEAQEGLETANADIKALEGGIKALDKDTAEAAGQRKKENHDFTEVMAADAAAKRLLEFAKNRLNQFYNAALHKEKAPRVLTEEERITVNFGGNVPTAAPGGIANTGIAVFAQRGAPPPPPAALGAYAKKGEENNGVLAMIDLLIKDLDKEMTEAKVEEEQAQKDYELLMRDSAEKRKQDANSITERHAAAAALESDLAEYADSKASSAQALAETMKYVTALHAECDWLLQNMDARKQARTTEGEQLQEAKAVLSGADFS